MDCEGCEHIVLPPFFEKIASGQIHVNQVQVEMHLGTFQNNLNFFSSADSAGLRIFHKERNHWGCKGYTCVEYALVAESFLRESNRYSINCPSVE
ncbi:hypothetical protein ACHAXR_001987 [Thalassiosira sp. AJA248-18]